MRLSKKKKKEEEAKMPNPHGQRTKLSFESPWKHRSWRKKKAKKNISDQCNNDKTLVK